MNSEKSIGLDVHQATICVAVMDPKGKVVMESHPGNQSHNHSGVLDGTAWNFVGDFAGVGGGGSILPSVYTTPSNV
jgi:hypothetical protein